MYDIIIVGAGPAGITAAIYAARRKLKILVITKNIGGQAAMCGKVENYTGFQLITGPELAKKFEEHLEKYQIEMLNEAEVIFIDRRNEFFLVKTKSKEYESKTIIMATGRSPKTLGIKGESEYKGRGVAYCATCDAPLFAKKDVAVVGGGNSAVDAVLQLMPIAHKVYLINVNKNLIGEEVMIEKIINAPNVEMMSGAKTEEILGDKFVNAIRVVQEGKEERKIDVKGVFIEIGSIPVLAPSQIGPIKTNENMEIIVNENCETNIPGFFAAGDVTNVPVKQVIVATGQGCIASISAFKFISRLKLDK